MPGSIFVAIFYTVILFKLFLMVLTGDVPYYQFVTSGKLGQYWQHQTTAIVDKVCSASFIFRVNGLELLLGTQDVPTIKIFDRADEFRIQIVGRLEGQSVTDASQAWCSEMKARAPRKCIVDISRLSGYDAGGLKLLREMYQHGTQVAAATPLSLVFLNEISAPRRRGPALVREQPRKRAAPAPLYLRAAGE